MNFVFYSRVSEDAKDSYKIIYERSKRESPCVGAKPPLFVENESQSSTIRTVRTLLFEAYVRIFTYAILAYVAYVHIIFRKKIYCNFGIALVILFCSFCDI